MYIGLCPLYCACACDTFVRERTTPLSHRARQICQSMQVWAWPVPRRLQIQISHRAAGVRFPLESTRRWWHAVLAAVRCAGSSRSVTSHGRQRRRGLPPVVIGSSTGRRTRRRQRYRHKVRLQRPVGVQTRTCPISNHGRTRVLSSPAGCTQWCFVDNPVVV